MELLLAPVVFFVTLAATVRSLGWGLTAVLSVGYLNGVIRANLPSVVATFTFDIAVFGLYLGFLGTARYRATDVFAGSLGQWVLPLMLWALLMAIVPVNDLMVQLVALRGNLWLLPVMLVATRLTAGDLDLIARALVGLNLMALAVAVYEYFYGIEAIFPRTAVTDLMYRSKDVSGYTHYRIPATFLSAHAYGGAMMLGLPFLFDRAVGKSGVADKAAAWVGIAAAAAGILMCAARAPAVVGGAALLMFVVLSRLSVAAVLPVAAAAAGAAYLANTDERLRRVASLDDTDALVMRLHGSANASFLDLIVDYPLGAGMGTSVGTSVPAFLANRAPTQVGLENEYCRLLIDQGLIGLGLWLLMLGWLLARPPAPRFAVPWRYGLVMMYAVVAVSWATAFTGTGILSSVPGSVLLLVQMGLLARERAAGRAGGQPPRSARRWPT